MTGEHQVEKLIARAVAPDEARKRAELAKRLAAQASQPVVRTEGTPSAPPDEPVINAS